LGEIDDVTQIIRLAFDGCHLVFNVGKTTVSVIKKIVMVIYNIINREKLQGKTSMKKLLQRGSNLQVFKFDEKQMDKVLEMAKKYGILFSVLPEINKADGFREIVFHNEDLPRVNAMIEHLKEGQIETMTDYVNNADPKDFREEIGDVEKEIPGMEKIDSIELEGRLRVIEASHNPTMQLVTIGKDDIVSEDGESMTVKIPDSEDYLTVSKADSMKMKKDGSWTSILEKDKTYEIRDKDGKKKSAAKGEELSKKYEHSEIRTSLAERDLELRRAEAARKEELRKAETKKQAAEKKKVRKAVKKGGRAR
jgi:hypothetical protein